jgi:hypothetical protein
MNIDHSRCPKSPDGRHRWHSTGCSTRIFPDATELRIACLACARPGYALVRDCDLRWTRKGPDWLKESDGGIDHAQGTGQ